MSDEKLSEIVQHKSAVFAALVSSTCLAILLVTVPALYIKANNAQERVADRMQNFRVMKTFLDRFML